MGAHLLYPDATCLQEVAVPCPALHAPRFLQRPMHRETGDKAWPSRSVQSTEKPSRGQSVATGQQAGPGQVPRLSPEVLPVQLGSVPAPLRWLWGPGRNEARAEGP